MNEVLSQQCKEFIVACWVVNVGLYVLVFVFEAISCSEEEIGPWAVVKLPLGAKSVRANLCGTSSD